MNDYQILPTRIDLDLGEEKSVELCDGTRARVKATAVKLDRNKAGTIRRATISVQINDQEGELISASYQLPQSIGGVQVDCPVTKDFVGGKHNPYRLEKDVRLRLWPQGTPWIEPGAMIYPVKQIQWLASSSQMGNEPTYVNQGSNRLWFGKGRYHEDQDFGGADGRDQVIAATDGIIVSAGNASLPEETGTPARTRKDVVYVRDARGWYYRYSHLDEVDSQLKPGDSIRQGQRIGLLGKEGASGGWAHLHFGVWVKMPSGEWGSDYAYPFIWQAYQEQFHPQLIAVARPSASQSVGEPVLLDGRCSWSATGKIVAYEWTLSDGETVKKPVFERVYEKPGTYSEILKVTDAAGNVDYDFKVVQIGSADMQFGPPSIHAAYHPGGRIRPGDPVTFMVRSFGMSDGQEVWDFGDGSATVAVTSDGCVIPRDAYVNNDEALKEKFLHAKDGYASTVHRFEKRGMFLVKVSRTNGEGISATARLKVVVE